MRRLLREGEGDLAEGPGRTGREDLRLGPVDLAVRCRDHERRLEGVRPLLRGRRPLDRGAEPVAGHGVVRAGLAHLAVERERGAGRRGRRRGRSRLVRGLVRGRDRRRLRHGLVVGLLRVRLRRLGLALVGLGRLGVRLGRRGLRHGLALARRRLLGRDEEEGREAHHRDHADHRRPVAGPVALVEAGRVRVPRGVEGVHLGPRARGPAARAAGVARAAAARSAEIRHLRVSLLGFWTEVRSPSELPRNTGSEASNRRTIRHPSTGSG